MHQTFFTPGPAQLYYTVEGHIKQALKENVMSISHRSKSFEKIYEEAESNIRELLNIPSDYFVFFTSSANEIWERLIQNCVESQSFHLTNGAFSNRFYKVSAELGRKAVQQNCNDGFCVSVEELEISSENELIAVTQNETSTGAAQPVSDIYWLRQKYPDALLTVDMVSAYPYIDLDISQTDSVYFSVQKGFGLPAGLGVWVLNSRCVEKSKALEEKGLSTGSYHKISSLMSKAVKHQTPETPNVLGIYLLGKVSNDMLVKGISQIRRESEYKAAVCYQSLQNHPVLSPFVKEEKLRSKTVIVAESKVDTADIINSAAERGMRIGSGYGGYKNQHLRIANFPTHSKEQFEKLADFLEAYRPS